MSDYSFDAFISYSHKDMKWAKWLQNRLETFRIPKDMTNDETAGRRLRVFRDQTDLAGVELNEALKKELAASRFLIVICSPNSAASRWVNDEVLSFISDGRMQFIIPFIVEGEPESDDPSLECYPEALRSCGDRHMLGANIQEIGKNKAFLKLLSIILDVRFNRLVDREKQRKRRTILSVSAAAAVIALIVAGLLVRNAAISQKNHELSYDMYGAAMVSIAEKDVIEPEDVEFLLVSAGEGNTDAIVILADCYKNGWGTEADPEASFYWSKTGAEAGDTTSMVSLANCYYEGFGTEADPEQSFYWNLKAAEQGNTSGMLNSGIDYEEGIGTEADPEKAFSWYQKAADDGYDLAMYNLARCYMSGTGTAKDEEKAFEWMSKLAATGNAEGIYNLGMMYQYGFGTQEDPQLAYEWYRKGAEAGDSDCAYMVGWCTENSYGTDDAALEWYRRAEELGCDKAQAEIERLESAADKD